MDRTVPFLGDPELTAAWVSFASAAIHSLNVDPLFGDMQQSQSLLDRETAFASRLADLMVEKLRERRGG